MSKPLLLLLCLLFCLTTQQTLKPLLLLPTETTQNVAVDYAFKFSTDTNIPHSGSIVLTFPFEYDPRELIRYTGCFFAYGNATLQQMPCTLNLRTFSISIGQIVSGQLTVLIKNIRNPIQASMSSQFYAKTMFRDVTITESLEFGKLPFTKASIITSTTGQVFNFENNLIEQGSTWVFRFTLAGSYGENSTIRFVFPDGFSSNKVQCNITGIIDSTLQTRVFPQRNIFECLNVKASLSGYQNIILSGVVNPKYEMQMQGLQVQIIQPNNLVVLEKISITNQPPIKAKNMNATVSIPNNFRNNSITYTFEINMDSTLEAGDYVQVNFAGNWTFFLQDSRFIEGVESSPAYKARLESTYQWPTFSRVSIKNFSRISKESQLAFYLSLKTPIQSSLYNLTITAFKANGKVVQFYTRNIDINQTTGYIKQMKLHPMNQAVKLPVGEAGPLEITLALRNNLPKTNVLTYGKIVIDITPHIPYPNISKNGVHKCYFYGDIPAKNCTYDVDTTANPTVTHIVAFTPVDFNFQSSQIPFMVTTQGFQTDDDEGLTIDTLVKRYHFHIQFYTDYKQQIPTEVIFTEWVADAIPLTSLSCNQAAIQGEQWNHLKCTFTTPNQVLNDAGHIHIIRFEFTNSGWYPSLGYTAETLYPDYPCLVYGPNILSTPYPKCDLYTYVSNPAYKSDAGVSYINVYGIETIPPNSLITFEFPKLKRINWNYPTSLNFSILEDTYGYETHYIGLYSQQLNLQSSSYIGSTVFSYTSTSVTVVNSNSVVNKVGSITLSNIDLGVSGCDYVILQVDQGNFPDIGRSQMFTCGSHKCSKFNKPIQYFILYPQTTLARYQNLVFPSILNPSKAGVYTFYLRAYKAYSMQKKISFGVTVTPDTLVAPVYSFASYETATQIFPNTKRYYKVSFTLKNKLAEQTSWIEVTFDNFFTLSSTYCDLTTTAQPWDGKGIECEVWQGETKVLIQNMKETAVGQTFTLNVQMTTTSSAASISPTVSVITYVSGGSKVDQFLNAPFSPTTITNTNLQTLNSLDFSKSYEFWKQIRKGYFGDLIVYYDSGLSQSSANTGTSLVLTFTPEFYPYSNALNLPLSCRINGIRYPCSYTLNPFEVTISGMGSGSLNAGNSSVVNITTNYLERNGIYFPANQGRYLFKAQLKNSGGTVIENSEQFIDILPGKVQYFNMSYAHRDANQDNIYIAEFQNGPTTISAYNDATNASRIYVEFPQVNSDGSGTVFSSNLGFSNGTIVPCYFDVGADFITPIAGKKLECRLRRSASSSVPVSVEIINFDSIGAFKKMRVFMGKIRNPVTKIMDMNFNLRINYYNPSTYQEHPQYLNEFNLFIDMLDASISTPTNADKTSQMFQPGAKVGDFNKYINHIPYNASSGYAENDWFIVVMNSEFQLNGVINNCLYNFYKRCIVYKQINWVAIQINNGTLIPFYPQITQMPLSISRVDTYYVCYSWKAQRWTQTITYTISASDRWLELRGTITNFGFKVLGSQNKLNINQKNVDVMVSFTVSHKVPAKGTIQIKFPNDPTRVPSIKPHCRSAVSMGSQLYGQNTGKPATNRQGEIGCLVQNTYSWLITSYQELPANSNVMISGVIDFPTVLTSTLGTGYIVTYTNEHASNVFANGRIIDYLSTSFPLQVENKTWNLVKETSLVRSEPLRVNHIGRFEFKLQMQDYIRQLDTYYTGYIDVNFWRYTILGDSGGFGMPSGSSICTIVHETTKEKFACLVDSVTQAANYITYRLKFYYVVSANTPYLVTISTQKGDSNEGITWPSTVGTYKIQTEIMYYTNYSTPYPPQVSKAHFIEVYGPRFNALNLVNSISIPAQPNLLLFEIVPSSNITNNYHRIVIQIPTISNDNVNLFDEDLGMGYQNNDDLIFDLYDSSISSMKCKVYLGNRITLQPTRIICTQFNVNNITISNVVRFGFWVKNPNTTQSLAIPIQVYVEQTNNFRKLQWQILEAGIKVIPTSVSPINDYGNFYSDTPFRQVKDTKFRFTNRNTKPLQAGDYYIMKFNFDLRKSDKQTSAFKYPYSSYTNTGDAIFLRNCQTILLRVGATALANFVAADAAQTNKLNVLLDNVMYNPSTKLTATESTITAYAVYMATEQCEKITHKDAFPTLSPYEPTTPDFTMTAINSNLRKGQYEDYKFTFRMNNDILTDTALVKKISIQFPADTLYDFKFRGKSCIEDPSTTIEIKKCTIDTSTYTIWIDPLVKSTYINNNYIIFQTIGKAIINPVSKLGASDRMYLNNFIIKYYTWANDDNPPAIFATSDDYCFMRQDSSYLSNTAYLTYTSTTVGHHDFADISEQVYVNEFLPLSTDIGGSSNKVRVPLSFKFIAPTAFANRDGTGSYHVIKVNYGNTYSVPTQTRTNDLYRLIPTCELNGYRILSCSIDTTNKEVSMSFQQAIVAGEEVSVKFSVLDPVDGGSDGFITANTNSPMLTLPVFITPSGGTNYYIEAQSFPTYYKSSGITYPSMGISRATVAIGTQVFGKMNYLDFVIQFSRSDVNGLILQIPLVQLDGSIIYSNSKLLNLESGAEYPCSVGHGMNVFCHYERGETKTYGKPTRIYISRWAMPASNTLSLRMLFTNPDIINVFPTFTFKAFGGTIDNTKFMGEEFMGEFSILNAFKTLPATPTYFETPTCLFYPTRRLYATSTNVQFYINNDITVGGYVMLEWPLHDSVYGEVSMYQVFNNTYDYDYFVVNYARNNRKLYIVKKITSYWGGSSSSHHDFGYLRNKHFLVNSATIYYFQTPHLNVYSCSLNHTWHNDNRDVNQFSIAIAQLDLQDRISGGWGWQHLSIDLSSSNPSSFNSWLNTTDPGDMVVVVKWVTNLPYSALSASPNDCSLEDGLRNTNLLKPITCTIDVANNEIVFKNVNKFSGRYLKFYYYAQTLGSNTWNHQVQVRVYGNNDAYVSNSWEIWSDTSPYYSMNGILLAVDGGYSNNMSTTAEAYSWSPEYIWNHDTDSGSVRITALSSTSITISATKGSTFNQPNVYKMSFRFYTQRLTFSGGCSVSSSGVPRTGGVCTPSGNSLILNYSFYDTSNNNGHGWSQWTAGTTYTWTFSVSVSGQLNADYLFITMAYSWFRSVYYWRDAQCGTPGCPCNQCNEPSAFGGQSSTYCCGNCCDYYGCWCCCDAYYSTRYCRYWNCRWYWSYGGQIISGKGITPYYNSQSFVSSYSGDLISYQKNVQTQLMIHFTNFLRAVGPSQETFVMFQLNGQSFTNNNPFPYTSNSEYAAEIDCKCVVATTGTMSITSSTSYVSPRCVRYLPVLTDSSMEASVGISIDVSAGQDLRCYFPGYLTTSSTVHNIDIFLEENNYIKTDIPRKYWARYSQYNSIDVSMNTYNIPYGISFDDYQDYWYENNFWSSGQTTSSRYYELNFSMSYNEAYPEIYMSMYAPVPVYEFCTTTSWSFCRFYDSFINRKYFFVAKSTSSSISYFRISGTSNYPPALDIASSFYNTLLYVTQPSYSRYLYSYSNARTSSPNFASVIYPQTNSKAIQTSMFGSFLQTYNSSLIVSVYFPSRKIYSVFRDYGQYRGSFIKVSFSGLTNLKGCSATLKSRPINMDAPFYCQVISNSQINIFSRIDFTITDYMYFTVYTAGLPASSTYTVELFEKYISASNYARSYAVSGTYCRSRGGYSTMDPTQIQWRRPFYKEYMTTSGPVRFKFRNNLQYVSDYSQSTFAQTSSTNAIVVYMPTGFSSSDTYICYAKEYLPGKESLFRRFQVPCGFWSYGGGNKVHIKPLPAYILKPAYFYEFVVYRHTNTSTMLITLPTADVFSMEVLTSSVINTETVTFYDYFDFYKYKNVYPCTLNSIYTLTKQAAANNSLYIDFTLNINGTNFNYFQFEISALGLSSFKIENGDEIPCFLSTEFATVGGKTQAPRCYGYTNQIGADSPLVIRVFGMASWTNLGGTNFKLAFDNFNNPAVQRLFLVPIDITFRYIDRQNRRKYLSTWPSVYLSDSINMGSPTEISGSLSRNNDYRGQNSIHYISIGWPYTSSSDTSQKVVLKLAGGVLCCQPFSSINLRDNYNSYTLLWRDTKANMSVYLTPAYNAGWGRDLWINSVNNPYPYQRDTYQKMKKIQILFYNNWRAVYSKKLDQFDYGTYWRYDEMTIDASPSLIDSTKSYYFHDEYPLTYKFSFSTSRNEFNNRQLSYTIVTFTSGITWIDWVHAGWTASPNYFNSLLQVTIGRNANNKYFLNISGMSESSYSTSYNWYFEMRFLTSSDTISYTSETYNLNGELQFTNSRTLTISSGSFQTSPYAPTAFELREKKYFRNYFQLQRIPIYAKASASASKLEFRFKTPYSIINQETIDFILPDSTQLYPINSPSNIYCLIRRTITTNLETGISRWAACSYSSGRYRVTNPIGNLLADTEYTLTILERNQTTSTFKLPYTPKRIDISQIYTSQLNLMYGDVYELDFEGRMNSISWTHASLAVNQRNMIGINFNPQFTLSAASLVSPVTETMLELEIYSKEFDSCIGAGSIFSSDNAYFASGTYYSHFSSPAVANANTRLKCGQFSESFAPIKLTTTDYGQVSANTGYYFRYPLILNPNDNFIPFLYSFRLIQYPNDAHYPVIVASYEYNGLQYTVNGNTYGETGQVSASNNWVQSTISLTFTWPYFNQGAGSQTWLKWKNNQIEALTDITALKTITTSNYNYEYYPNLNLCVYIKTNNVDSRTVNLGSFPSNDDIRAFKVSWIHLVYSNKYQRQQETNLAYWTNDKTGWDSSSFTLLSGLKSTNSEGLFRISWMSSSLKFVQGSYMKVTIQNSPFSILDEYCLKMTGFYQGTTSSNSNLICRRTSATEITIEGYQTINTGTTLSLDIYLEVASNTVTTYNSIRAYVQVFSQDDKAIIQAITNNLASYGLSQGAQNLKLENAMRYKFLKDTARELYVQFRLATNTLGMSQYVEIDFGDWQLDTSATGKIVASYKVGSNYYYSPCVFTKVSGNKYRFGVYKNVSTYSMTANQVITLLIDHVNPDNFYGILVPNTRWNYIKITAHTSAGVVIEHQFAQIWVQPYQHLSFDLQPALDYVNAISIYEFTVTPNVSVAAGDYISIEFTTGDGLYSDLFATNLGKTIPTNDSLQLSCRETNNAMIISNSNIKCELFKGDISTSPTIPTTIQIKVEKNIAANQLISFNILSLKNPARANYWIGVTFKLSSVCYQQDINRLCNYYKSTKYMSFKTAAAVPATTSNFGTLSFNPNIVSATNSKHTFGAPMALAVGDFVKIVYYPEVVVKDTCSLQGSNGVCYSYSLENTIIIKATVAQTSPFSFILNGMTNLYQYSGNTLYTEIWQASTKTITKIFTTSYTVPIITTDPISGSALSITFEPTLTPNYQLSYNFDNIAKVQISYLLQNDKVQQILLTAPTGITLNTKYCNATLESSASEAKPYPYRFKCEVISSSQVRITQNSNFPVWTSAFINKKVIVYLMYTISQSLLGISCQNWVATTYTHPTTVSTNLRVSEAVGNFPVELYMSPFIYKVDFFTYSFTKRICQTGELCMFYGYLLPTTPQASFQIKYMDYTIPPQFKYSNLVSYNGCDMKEKNSDNYLFGCTATRNNSKVTVRFMPDVSYTYNHNYKLLKIDNVDATKLFTAPQYPGTHYQMKVDLYTNTNLLIESQYINLTTVYGKLLSWNDIAIKIPQDADTVGVFEFTFKVGASDVEPAYESSSINRITSAIQIIFSNSFAFDLGTGKKAGQQVACLPILNLNLNTMGKLTCKIYPSTSTITNPTIIVTGYDKILSGQLVTFMVAGLKSLPNNITDYIKIGVSYTYYDYGNVKGYLYEPTGKVVGPVTLKNVAKTITVAVTETSSNIVGELVNYSFTCTFTAGFAPVTSNDYLGIQFPDYGFEGRFNLNPKAKCSPASSQKCLSFGLANVIYFKPATAISSTTLSFTLSDTINTAFAFDYKSIEIKIFTVIGGKIDSSGTGTLVKFSKPSLNISGLVTKTDSIYGGQSEISYYVDFKLGTYLPEYGKVSITFPNVYTSLFDLYVSCKFTDDTMKKMSDNSFCTVVSNNQLVIAPNGILLNKDTTYSIIIYNLTNPNANISMNRFTIQSFYSSDIYNKQIISQNTFSPPEINVLLVKTCQFDLTVETKNQNYRSFYSMALICPSVIKEASRLQVFLPWNLTNTAKQLCTSQSNSLYSYECSIKNEFINNRLTSFMQIYLKEHVPQKLISLKGQITNGIKGSYTLNASISYKGFTYLVGTSNRILIDDTNVNQLNKMQIIIQNFPYNRKYESLYTFKITNPKISANSIRIDVPSVITKGPNGISCNSELSNTNKDYFMFLALRNTTELICSMDGQSILISGILPIIQTLKNDEFLFLDVFGLKNPDISQDKSEFKFTFLNITDSTGLVIGSLLQNLAYKVSQPPTNMQMNSITLSTPKFEVINNYTFISSTIANALINITAKSDIGVKIFFPIEYTSIWKITPQPSNIKIYLGNTLYTATNINMVNRILMAKFSIDTFVSFSQVKVVFEFRNPSTAINCTASNFVVSLFDFKQNSVIAETVGNNVACLQFSGKLFWIKVSGNSEIRSGNFSVYTIELEKPAKYLKITPRTSSSAITFSPASITFDGYGPTIQQFRIVSSPAFVGNFLITFSKEQMEGDLFYNDIENQTVTLVAPIAPFMINFEQNSVKSVGQPIDSFIGIQVPSTVAFALLHSNNCSSDYDITPVGRITIPPGSNQVSFSIKYKGNVIPYMCAIKFEISSLTNINYALATNVLYLSGEPSIDRTNSLRPMILRITKQPRDSKDVGTSILTKDSKSTLKPTVYDLKATTAKANSIEMEITTSEPGFIYYAAMETGTQQDKVTQKMIFDQNIKTGLAYNKTRAVISSLGNVNIITPLLLTGLESDKRYLIGAYVNSTVGLSDIKFTQVQTLKSSNGAVIKICFNAIQLNDTVLATVSKVLRIKPDRLSVFTFKEILMNSSSTYSNAVMNSRRYVYELVLAPNRFDDSITPMDSFNELIGSKDLQNKIKASISSFDLTYTMTAHELILAKPKIRGSGITVEQLTYQNVRVSVQFWEVAYVYGVIVEADSSRSALQTQQIIDGVNRQNVKVNATHRVATQTNDEGIATLEFRLLSEKTDYEIFVTAECVLPYNPRAQLLDSQVLKQSVKTTANLNVANNGERIIEQLKQIKNDNLAQAVKEHLLSVEQKKVLNEKVTKIRKRK